MRRFLYSRWFFFFLAVVCLIDLLVRSSELVWDWTVPIVAAIAMDAIAAALALWVFIDLQSRKPKTNGHNTRR